MKSIATIPTRVNRNYHNDDNLLALPLEGFEALLIDRSGGHTVEGRTMAELLRAIVFDHQFDEALDWNCGMIRNVLDQKFHVVQNDMRTGLRLYVQHPK